MEAPYNKVPDWGYSKIGELFGPGLPFKYFPVRTPADLHKVLSDKDFCDNPSNATQLVELFLDRHDAPSNVKQIAAGVEEFNKINQ